MERIPVFEIGNGVHYLPRLVEVFFLPREIVHERKSNHSGRILALCILGKPYALAVLFVGAGVFCKIIVRKAFEEIADFVEHIVAIAFALVILCFHGIEFILGHKQSRVTARNARVLLFEQIVYIIARCVIKLIALRYGAHEFEILAPVEDIFHVFVTVYDDAVRLNMERLAESRADLRGVRIAIFSVAEGNTAL